jgi:hypothetical protein
MNDSQNHAAVTRPTACARPTSTAKGVYPQLALLPMIAAQGLAPLAGYYLAWALVVTAVDALAFAVLVGRAHAVGRRAPR